MDKLNSPSCINSRERKTRKKIWVGLETISKLSILGSISFLLVLHFYTGFSILANGVIPELVWPTLVFDIFIAAGVISLLIISEYIKRAPLICWIFYLVTNILAFFLIFSQSEYFDVFDTNLWGFFYSPLVSSIIISWLLLLLLSFAYLIGVGINTLVRLGERTSKIILNSSLRHRIATGIMLLLPLASIGFAPSIANLVVMEGAVKRTISFDDNNMNCTFSIWDFPEFITATQLENTREIDLGQLTVDENRTLIAFGKMNSTFYSKLDIDTDEQKNMTYAILKTLEAFNITVCATVWYSDAVDEDFPKAKYADDWINSARKSLEYVINNNITNVVGICADSEGDADVLPDEYWTSIEKYDNFLQEVQSNVSLRNPRPEQETFKTVLTFEPTALTDAMDGDQDMEVTQRKWGPAGYYWTDYHFMCYRLSPGANTGVLYNYLQLMEKHFGKDSSTAIVGLTGVEWFQEGYYDGNYETFGREGRQVYDYDGIDGWEAMKREILICKAMGFSTVSIFHMKSYGDPTKIEDHGLLDYYGLEKLEELADEWYQNKTITYPISSIDFNIATRGFFRPNDEYQYDLVENEEMVIFQIILFVSIAIGTILSIIKTRHISKIQG